MTILHIQRTSAFNKNDFAQCVLSIKHGDALVFIDDGCYNVNHSLFVTFKAQNPEINVYHIKTHAQARGVNVPCSLSTPITMEQLVDLTFKYSSSITWQ